MIANKLSILSSVPVADACFNICIPAPLKGIPKAPFRSPTAPSIFSPPSNRTPIAPARTPLRKERGVKVMSDFPKMLPHNLKLLCG